MNSRQKPILSFDKKEIEVLLDNRQLDIAEKKLQEFDLSSLEALVLKIRLLLLQGNQDELFNLILSKEIPAGYQSPSGRILFHELIALCDCEIIKKIKINDNLLRKKNEKGLTPLAVAISADKIDIGKYLLSVGSSADEAIALPWATPFGMAISLNKISWINLFLENGVNINQPLKKAGSYLSMACNLKQWEIAQKILEHGGDPNYAGENGTLSPLSFCVIDKNKNFLKQLLNRGACLEYSKLFFDSMKEKRFEKIKQNISLDVNIETDSNFSLFWSHLRQEDLSKKEWDEIEESIKSKLPKLSCDENRRFAISTLNPYTSTIVWPKDNSYKLVSLPRVLKIEQKEPLKISENETESNTQDDTEQMQTKQFYHWIALIVFLPLWLILDSFTVALVITISGFYIIKHSIGESSQ